MLLAAFAVNDFFERNMILVMTFLKYYIHAIKESRYSNEN